MISGPMIYAEEDDTVVVVFKNNLEFAVNIQPAGLLASPAVPVAPNSTVTYTWVVPERALGSINTTSQLYLYR